MSTEHPKSLLFFVGISAMAVVWLTLPFWGPKKEPLPMVEARSTAKPGFRYAPTPATTATAVRYDDTQIRRQLDRHARMHTSGLYARVLDNPEIPGEIRSRFAKEKTRLDALAAAHPTQAEQSREGLVPPAVQADGSFTPAFAEVVSMLKQSGVWDKMVENHVEQMRRDAANSDLPPSMRPTEDEIEAVRRDGHIPTL